MHRNDTVNDEIRLGNAFQYGLTVELPELELRNKGNDGFRLYAALSYMCLNGLISDDVSSLLGTELLEMLGPDADVDLSGASWLLIENVIEQILSELMKKYEFKDLNHLVGQLNEIIVPEWYFYAGRWLMERIRTGTFLYEDSLYYIVTEDDRDNLYRLHTDCIDDETDLDSCGEKLGKEWAFCKVEGFDKKAGKAYLSDENCRDFYGCYDIASGTLIVCHGRFLLWNEGIPFVITEDHFLAYVDGDTLHKIKKYYDHEKYRARKGCLLVYPSGQDGRFFYPFCVTLDGEVIPADEEDCRDIIWEKINLIEENMGDDDMPFGPQWIGRRHEIPMPEKLSVCSIMDSLYSCAPSSVRDRSQNAILYENILGLLGKLVDKDQDVTRLWYVLCEANLKLWNDEWNLPVFPSKKLYQRLKAIDKMEGENAGRSKLCELLESADYDEIGRLLCLGCEKADEVRDEKRIGGFLLGKNELVCDMVPVAQGMLIGNQVIPAIDLLKQHGIVTFDIRIRKYSITCCRDISKSDRYRIIERFRLQGEEVSFFVQPGIWQ